MAYTSVLSMMNGGGSVAPVPTQTFNSANILGTAVPQVGDSKGNPNYAAGIMASSNSQIILVALFLIGIGYVVYHFNFEK